MSTASVTPNIGLQIPATGSNNWYIPLNYNFNKIDQLLGGQIEITSLLVTNLTVTNFALTASNITSALGYSPLNPANNLLDVADLTTSLNNLGGIGAASVKGAWSSATTYSVADIVSDGATTYVSLVVGNLNNPPATSPSQWVVFINATGVGISDLTQDVTASGSGSVAATVVGINGVNLAGLGAGMLKQDASGVPSLASTLIGAGALFTSASTPANTFAQQWFSSEFIQAISTAAGGAALGLSVTAGEAVVSMQGNQPEMQFLLTSAYSSHVYEAEALLETTPASFLDSTNSLELQFGVVKDLPTITPNMAIGDATTLISNTNIKLNGAVFVVGGATADTLAFTTDGQGISFSNSSQIMDVNSGGIGLGILSNGPTLISAGTMAISVGYNDTVNSLYNLVGFEGVASLPKNNVALQLGNIAATGYLVQTAVTGQLLDSGNTYEMQIGIGANSGSVAPAIASSFAVGNVTTKITNTNIKLAGAVTVNGLPITGTPAFSILSSGTNTTAAMLVGTGASLAATGTGTIAATSAAKLAAGTAGQIPYQTGVGTTSFFGGTGLLKLAGTGSPAIATDGTDYLSPSTGVVSFKARTGVVVPVSGDYTAAQVTNALDLTKATTQTMAGALALSTVLAADGTAAFTIANSTGSITANVFTTLGSIISASFKDAAGTSFMTAGSGKATFVNQATFSAGLLVAVGQSVNTPIIRDNAGNSAATLSSGAFTFPQLATFSLGLTLAAGQTVTTPKIAIGGGQAMSNPPEMVASCGVVALGTLGNLSGFPLNMKSAITITRLEWQLNQTATGCTTQPQVTVMVNGVASALVATVALTSFFGQQDTNVNVPAGQNVQLKVTLAEAGCTPTTSTAQCQIHYIMQ